MKLFLTHKQYGERPQGHRDVHHVQPGWLFIEAGNWTLEVDYDPRMLRGALIAVSCVAPVLALFINITP
jgi:hypothetical protein